MTGKFPELSQLAQAAMTFRFAVGAGPCLHIRDYRGCMYCLHANFDVLTADCLPAVIACKAYRMGARELAFLAPVRLRRMKKKGWVSWDFDPKGKATGLVVDGEGGCMFWLQRKEGDPFIFEPLEVPFGGVGETPFERLKFFASGN